MTGGPNLADCYQTTHKTYLVAFDGADREIVEAKVCATDMPVAGGADQRNARIGIEPRVPVQARARDQIGRSSNDACKASLGGC